MPFTKRLVASSLSALQFHFLRFARAWQIVAVVTIIAVIVWNLFISAPNAFVPNTVVVIPRGTSVQKTSELLFDAKIIRSKQIFISALRITRTGDSIQAGAYRFDDAENVLDAAIRLVTGEYGIAPTKITFTEGMTVRDMAIRLAEKLPEVSVDDFISNGQPYEGYLFPDTYTFTPSSDAKYIVSAMKENFDKRVSALANDISASGHSYEDIIIMASLIEKEADTTDDMQAISGVLWNRIKIGMPLQVDAVFGYIFGRSTYSPSFDDLGVDSPYNTYTHTGLPPGPISNPGLRAIEAAINPVSTKAIYYLTGRDGILRTAVTYSQHIQNQRMYLR